LKVPFVRSLWLSLWLGCLGYVISAHAEKPLLQATASKPLMQAKQVVPNVYYVQGMSELGSSANQNFISNAGFVVTPSGVVVIDALGSPELARRLLAEIAKVTRKPIHTVVLTHYHADHIYGLQTFKALGARLVAHRAALQYLNSETARLRLVASRLELAPWVDENTLLVEADEWLDKSQVMTVGGVRFEITPVGPAHTPEDLVVYLPSEKVFFAGDLVFRSRIPYVGQADSRHWITALDGLLKFDTKVIVPGHGALSSEARDALQLTRDYLISLRTTMGQAAKNLEPFEDAYKATDWSPF